MFLGAQAQDLEVRVAKLVEKRNTKVFIVKAYRNIKEQAHFRASCPVLQAASVMVGESQGIMDRQTPLRGVHFSVKADHSSHTVEVPPGDYLDIIV